MKNDKIIIDQTMLLRFFNNETTDGETLMIRNWISESDENRKIFEQYKKIWISSANVSDFDDYNTELALQNVKKKIKQKRSRFSLKTSYRMLSIAAMLVIVFGCFWLIKNLWLNQSDVKTLTQIAQNKMTMILPDNSVVEMSEGSQLSYPEKFEGNSRTIRFSGEAFFKVSKNEEKPFIIKTQNTIVQVIGTEFNLQAIDSDSTEAIIVTEGKVRFTGVDNKGVVLQKGDKGKLNKKSKTIIKEKNTDKNFLAWKTGIFEFEDNSLGDVTKILSKYYNVNFSFKSLNISNIKLSAKYEKLDLQELIQILEITLNVKITKASEYEFIIE